MLLTRENTYQFAAQAEAPFGLFSTNDGREGGKGTRGDRQASIDHLRANPRGRLRAISKATSKELRHRSHNSTQRDGYMPLRDLLDLEAMQELFATQEDIRHAVRGLGGNNKLRLEMGVMKDRSTVAIRAAQGHSMQSGVAEDALPVAEGLMAIIHGTTLAAAKSIAHEGISKAGRMHVHFYESDMEGRPVATVPRAKLVSEVILVVSAEKCERFGLVFYRASNGVILTPGVDGMVHPQFILCVRRVSDYSLLWSALSQRWGSSSAPVLGARFLHGAGNQGETVNSSIRRDREPASSSGWPYTRSGAVTDDGNVSTLVEGRERHKRARRLGHEASPTSTPVNENTDEMRMEKRQLPWKCILILRQGPRIRRLLEQCRPERLPAQDQHMMPWKSRLNQIAKRKILCLRGRAIILQRPHHRIGSRKWINRPEMPLRRK